MTRCRFIRTATAGFAVFVFAATALPAEGSNKRLSQSYAYTVGDDVAERVGGLFRVVAGLEASTLVYYDRKEQNVVSYIVGSAEDINGAKREIEAFRGIDFKKAPPLKGYVSTLPRDAAEVILEAQDEDPLLAQVHVGHSEDWHYRLAAKTPRNVKAGRGAPV